MARKLLSTLLIEKAERIHTPVRTGDKWLKKENKPS